MHLIEEVNLSNGLTLKIFDLSREIAADTVKVEVSFQSDIELKESFFTSLADYLKVKNIFGNQLTYEYKAQRTFVRTGKSDAVRTELIDTFKTNSLHYLEADNFARKLALAMLRDINQNPYKYQSKADNET